MKIAVATFFILLSVVSSNIFAKTLTVGVATRFSDKYSNHPSRFSNGVNLAKLLFEESHPGTKIIFKNFQYGTDLETLLEMGKKIADSGEVAAVIGGETSLEAAGLALGLNSKKIVEITPASISAEGSKQRPFNFSTCVSDQQAGQALARYVFEKLKPKGVGNVQNLDSPEHGGAYYAFEEAFKGPSAPFKSIPYASEAFIGNAATAEKIIDSLKTQGVTHTAVFTNDVDAEKFTAQAARKNFFPVYIGGPEWGSSQYIYTRFVESSSWKDQFVLYRYDYWKEDSGSPMSNRFRAAFKARFHEAPVSWDAMSFDTAWVLFTAMAKAKNPNDGEQIRDQLKALKDLPLVTADRFSFEPNNIPIKDLVIYRIDKDGVKYETTLR